MKKTLGFVVLLSATVALAIVLSGCPPQSKGHVTALLSGNLNSGGAIEKNGEVGMEEIDTLVVTLTEISLDRSGNSDNEDDGSKVVVFSGSVDIYVRELVGVSEFISTADIPAGTYTKVRLSIENPRMTLVEDPEVVITDIQTTANGRLFVSSTFVVPENQNSLILLDFQGMHLVETGSGKYVWTPQLRAAISVVPADVRIQGRINSLDIADGTLTILPETDSELVLVHYAGAEIFLQSDEGTPTGTDANLTENPLVIIEGTLSVTGDINAEVIWILPVL